MKWIDSTDLRTWAGRRACQDTLPQLARKLIRASVDSIKAIKFPSGENVLHGGWDGILEATKGTEYFPAGISLWEFGAGKDPKGKADDDYLKRTNNPRGYTPSESTFIFVTPRLWQNGDEWVKEKMKEGKWKDIRVINAELLEEWIETAPTIGSWLSKHLGKFPAGGIQPTDDFWDVWTAGPKFKLIPEILLGGRKKEIEKTFELISKASVIPVQGMSREETLAFIISCFKNAPDKEEDFFARSIIVENPSAFRELSVHTKPLILIPLFDDNGEYNRAVLNGHTVIVPLGADSTNNWSDVIRLPQINRDSFVLALTKIGMSKEIAERYSKESVRNITVLRRRLEFTHTMPAWATKENVRDILPALIVGRWDESFEKDREIISQIAGKAYDDYKKKLSEWLHIPDSPIVKIGSTWRLVSPFDAWLNASKFLTAHDFELLLKSVLEILNEKNPVFDLAPEQRFMASFHGKKREFSDWIREGILQSLILTSILGERLTFDLPIKAELWVDGVIAELLRTGDALLWKSFESKLPLIAEASPAAFLDSIEKHLANSPSPVTSLFEEDPGFMTANSYHTGLLWALENLAWFPQYLSRSSLILARLAAVDPGGSLANRPDNSLTEIFKPWHYQTLASFKERLEVLKLIAEKEKDTAWKILIRLLPDDTAIGHPTHKTRWRMFELQTERPVSYKEIYETHASVIDILISIFDFTEAKLATLIEESVRLLPGDRSKVLSFVESVIPKIKQSEFTAWNTTRNILYHHHSHQDSEWALPVSELSRYEKLYALLEPVNEIEKTTWMFDDRWPRFPEGYSHGKVSHDEQEKIIRSRRIEALKDIYSNHGVKKIIELRLSVKDTWALGDALADIISNESDIMLICNLLNNGQDEPRFLQSFLVRKSLSHGLEWVFELFEKLKSEGYGNLSLYRLLLPLNQTKKLWDFVAGTNAAIETEYWKSMYPYFYWASAEEKAYGIKKLIEHNRYLAALAICSDFPEEISSQIILEILEKAGTEKTEEQIRLDAYQVSRLFEVLDKRNDFDPNVFLKIEWLFLPVLSSHGVAHKPFRLHSELSKNPVFFIDVLKWIYKPDDESKVDAERKGLSDQQLLSRANQAWELLHSWKTIPGVDENGVIDSEFLNNWVHKVRELGAEYGRLNVTDNHIGEILAQYPEKTDLLWPPDEICDLIETIKSNSISSGFSTETFNKRGFSSRGPFDGGEIEKGKAEYFIKLAEAHRNKYPTITKIFERLSKGYEEDARKMDQEAERTRLDY